MTKMSAVAGAVVEIEELSRRGVVRTQSRPRRFYLAITLILIAMVVRGFWPSYFGPLLSGGVTRPWIIHMHGVIFVGWMTLLLAQVLSVAVLTAAFLRIFFMESPGWLKIGRALLVPFV